MAVANDEVDVAFLEKVVLNTGENQGGVTFADFRDYHANGETALLTKRAGHQVWPVVEFAGRLANALLRSRWDGFSSWRTVDDEGNSSRGQAQVGGQLLQADRARRSGNTIGRKVFPRPSHGIFFAVVWHKAGRTTRASSRKKSFLQWQWNEKDDRLKPINRFI